MCTYLLGFLKVGLSSSQARLLSLTSRQHSVEGEAHRIQANKLRLANESDKVYSKYLNALDETSLQTLQRFKKTGAESWISGSLNNLLRYETSEDYTGNVFFVQDIASGKLYLPEGLADKYSPGMDIEDFVRSCDNSIIYTEVDHNEYILKKYEDMMARGYDTIASDAIISGYNIARINDNEIIDGAQIVLDNLPALDSSGVYSFSDNDSSHAYGLAEAIEALKQRSNYNTTYTDADKQILDTYLELYKSLGDYAPQDMSETEENNGMTTSVNVTYDINEISASLYNKKYLTDNNYSTYLKFLAALNGGEITFDGSFQADVTYSMNGNVVLEQHQKNDFSQSIDVYNDVSLTSTGTSTTASEILSENASGCQNYAKAISKIMKRAIETATNAEDYLNSVGKTFEDLQHYQDFKAAKADYDMYFPYIERIPNDKVKANYYEQIFKAIENAGGCIAVNDKRAKSDSWVGNMIKSAQVILSAWDNETEMLSKTAPSLNTNIQEVSDQNLIEKASQEYEAELDEINTKDARYDRRLAVLESERNAISTEIDSLKEIMRNNINVNFKVFT